MTSDTTTMTCVNHPGVETLVSCGKCGRPLCPKCMIFTSVGVRCKECARLRPPPQFDLTGAARLRVLGLAAAIVVLGGGALGLLHLVGFGLLVGIVFGFGIGEALSRASARKQGRQMELIVAGTLVLTLVAAYTVSFMVLGVPPPRALVQGLTALSSLGNLLGVILGVVVAIGRVR